jgi:hypothetical protein
MSIERNGLTRKHSASWHFRTMADRRDHFVQPHSRRLLLVVRPEASRPAVSPA